MKKAISCLLTAVFLALSISSSVFVCAANIEKESASVKESFLLDLEQIYEGKEDGDEKDVIERAKKEYEALKEYEEAEFDDAQEAVFVAAYLQGLKTIISSEEFSNDMLTMSAMQLAGKLQSESAYVSLAEGSEKSDDDGRSQSYQEYLRKMVQAESQINDDESYMVEFGDLVLSMPKGFNLREATATETINYFYNYEGEYAMIMLSRPDIRIPDITNPETQKALIAGMMAHSTAVEPDLMETCTVCGYDGIHIIYPENDSIQKSVDTETYLFTVGENLYMVSLGQYHDRTIDYSPLFTEMISSIQIKDEPPAIEIVDYNELSSHASTTNPPVNDAPVNEILEKFDGAEWADFGKFNSPAKENGLKDTRVYIKGTVTDVIPVAINSISLYGGMNVVSTGIIMSDIYGYEWHMTCMIQSGRFHEFTKMILEQEILVVGKYSGYSSVLLTKIAITS